MKGHGKQEATAMEEMKVRVPCGFKAWTATGEMHEFTKEDEVTIVNEFNEFYWRGRNGIGDVLILKGQVGTKLEVVRESPVFVKTAGGLYDFREWPILSENEIREVYA